MQHDWLVLSIIIVAAVGLGVASAMFFSSDARLRRRRRKSHSRIISKSNRPSVKFSVRPPKE